MEYMQFTVTAVVVSYNREALLRECLDGIAAQTRPVDRIVVIDNASTDGALEVARNHPLITGTAARAKVVALSTNMGGAGGFCAGIAEALAMEHEAKAAPPAGSASAAGCASGSAPTCHPERSAQRAVEGSPTQRSPHPRHYIWLMDDDTIPTPGALAALLDAVELSVERNHALPVALGSRAVWVDGREHLMNKPMERTWVRKGLRHLTPEPLPEQASEAAAGASPSRESESAPEPSPEAAPYQVRSLSFVSCLLSAGAIKGLARLPKSAYFLWNDDFEFTTALLRRGIGYYVPASEVIHKTKVFGSSDADPGARFYNEVRNKLWLFRFSRSNFNAAELTEFLLKTVRRWVLTWLRSKDRALIADCFRRGWHDGMRTMPPSNAELFAAEPEVAEAIRAVER